MKALELVRRADATVEALYSAGLFDLAEDLDALLVEVEALLEDNGDLEENGDLEDDQLSEVDEDGGHEFATELPEDDVEDDDLNFSTDRGRYASTKCPRFWEERDEDLEFAWEAEHRRDPS